MTHETLKFVLEKIETPFGKMLVATDAQARLRALDWEDHEARALRLMRLHYGDGGVALLPGRTPDAVRGPLLAYLSGDLRAIERIAVATGGTAPCARSVSRTVQTRSGWSSHATA
jgi:methylated-DNA-[protein]-cysteine S-methyltransferase